jgi:hypothetical protein
VVLTYRWCPSERHLGKQTWCLPGGFPNHDVQWWWGWCEWWSC